MTRIEDFKPEILHADRVQTADCVYMSGLIEAKPIACHELTVEGLARTIAFLREAGVREEDFE